MRSLCHFDVNKALAMTALVGLFLVGCDQKQANTQPPATDSTATEVAPPAADEEVIAVDPTEEVQQPAQTDEATVDTPADATADAVQADPVTGSNTSATASTPEEQVTSQNPDQSF